MQRRARRQPLLNQPRARPLPWPARSCSSTQPPWSRADVRSESWACGAPSSQVVLPDVERALARPAQDFRNNRSRQRKRRSWARAASPERKGDDERDRCMEPLLAERTHHLGEGAIDWTLFRDDCLSKAVVLLAVSRRATDRTSATEGTMEAALMARSSRSLPMRSDKCECVPLVTSRPGRRTATRRPAASPGNPRALPGRGCARTRIEGSRPHARTSGSRYSPRRCSGRRSSCPSPRLSCSRRPSRRGRAPTARP